MEAMDSERLHYSELSLDETTLGLFLHTYHQANRPNLFSLSQYLLCSRSQTPAEIKSNISILTDGTC